MIYVGIDNGLDGGIVALSPHGSIIKKWVMPTTKVIQPARKTAKEKVIREVDSQAFLAILNSLGNREHLCVTFEHCPFHADRAATMRSMAMTAGKLIGIMETRGVYVHRILNYDWQPSMLGKVPKGKTKEIATAKALSLWPRENWLANSRCRTPHDGMIDAALIAEYQRLRNL